MLNKFKEYWYRNKRDNRWMVIKNRKYVGQYKTIKEAVRVLKELEIDRIEELINAQ